MPAKVASTQSPGKLRLLIGGKWRESESQDLHPVYNPADGRTMATVPFSTREEVSQAVSAADEAFASWAAMPVTDRIQLLFRMKEVLENHAQELATLNTENHGKTLEESRGDVRRTIENVESAISIAYTLAKGTSLDEISPGIDELMVKEPLGAFAIVCPFNFPIMIPFWFLPYALVLGDTVVVKPSEITPVPMQRVAELLQEEVNLPPGVLNLVHGGSEVVETLIGLPATKGEWNVRPLQFTLEMRVGSRTPLLSELPMAVPRIRGERTRGTEPLVRPPSHELGRTSATCRETRDHARPVAPCNVRTGADDAIVAAAP